MFVFEFALLLVNSSENSRKGLEKNHVNSRIVWLLSMKFPHRLEDLEGISRRLRTYLDFLTKIDFIKVIMLLLLIIPF